MSRVETYRGRLIKVQNGSLPNEWPVSLEELCKKVLEKNGFHGISKCSKSYTESIYDELDDKYVVLNNTLYEIEKEEIDGDDYFCNLKRNNDGSIDFYTQFYNGGTYLNEMLEDELINFKD
jgi:hypothetical protein